MAVSGPEKELGHDVIVRIAARGDGVTASGRHVPHGVTGDWLDAAGHLHHGPHHAQPPCPHFGRCGGCQLQHVDEGALTDFYEQRVASALAAQHVSADRLLPAHLSPPRSRRRASLRAQRLGNTVRLGFAEAGSHKLIDLKQCDIVLPEMFAQMAPLRRLLAALMGPRSNASVHLTRIDQGIDVLLSGVDAMGLAAHDAIMDFCTGGGIARLAIDAGDGPEDRWAPEPATVTIGGVAVPVPHGVFLQATAAGEQQLVDDVIVATAGAHEVADLFSGIGTFALSLPPTSVVHAVEAARDAIGALRVAANRAQRRISCDHRDLYRRPLTSAELARFEAVVLDPPRAGAQEQVVALAASTVPVIAYVSCNPTSFARDAATLLSGGYRLEWVRPVGQFRWSTHVELVGRFVR